MVTSPPSLPEMPSGLIVVHDNLLQEALSDKETLERFTTAWLRVSAGCIEKKAGQWPANYQEETLAVSGPVGIVPPGEGRREFDAALRGRQYQSRRMMSETEITTGETKDIPTLRLHLCSPQALQLCLFRISR